MSFFHENEQGAIFRRYEGGGKVAGSRLIAAALIFQTTRTTRKRNMQHTVMVIEKSHAFGSKTTFFLTKVFTENSRRKIRFAGVLYDKRTQLETTVSHPLLPPRSVLVFKTELVIHDKKNSVHNTYTILRSTYHKDICRRPK